MRFDLTNAAYRVFQRADKLRLQPGVSVIDAAKILLALFDEEESRAADWLNEKNLTAEDFRLFITSHEISADSGERILASIAANAPRPSAKKIKPAANVLRFYLDDVPVHAGRLHHDLESAFDMIAHRFARTERRKEAITVHNGGVKSIGSGTLRFTIATEHQLLAAVLDSSRTGQFLRDNGFDATELSERIDILQGGVKETADSESSAPKTAVPDTGKQRLLFPAAKQPTMRLLDAAANRGREALRVLEDYARFILDDAVLTQQFKTFRHALRETLNVFPLQDRLQARNTQADVGTDIEAVDEYQRQTVEDVLSANFSRLQESLRSLEEFAKLAEPFAAKRFEQLRYQSYTLQSTVSGVPVPESHIGDVVSPRLTSAQLYVLLDCRSDETAFAELAARLIDGGVQVIQLRDKSADDRTLLARSRVLKDIIGDRNVLFIMNDRPDLALLAQADGVHIGQDELPLADVRQIVGSEMLVGISTHNMAQARQAAADGADYIGAGPVFESATKHFDELAGLDFLREVAADVTIPAFAIGGITLANVDGVLETGISRIAVGSALLQADNPQEAAKRFIEVLERPTA